MSLLGVDGVACNRCLSAVERVAVRNSLIKLRANEASVVGNLETVLFDVWGKVYGSSGDYIIVQQVKVAQTINKSYYWSNDGGITFASLVSVDEWVSARAPLINSTLTGNPSNKYRDPTKPKPLDGETEGSEEDEEEVEEEDDETGSDDQSDGDPSKQKKVKERKLLEIERLAFIVQSVDHDCSLVPQGLYYLQATGDIAVNQAFKGLSALEARKLESYCVFRSAERPHTLARIRKMGTQNIYDFLDQIVPQPNNLKDTWSVVSDESGLNVSVRSLVWPGFEFKAEACSTRLGGGYYGYGIKNQDLLFML